MKSPLGWAVLTGFSLLFFAFIYAPLFVIIGYSFNANPINMMIWDGFTLDWYTGLFGLTERTMDANSRAAYIESTDQMLAALRNSLFVAVFTTTISTVMGTATAIALARYRFRARGVYNGFLMLPMMMPDIVLGIGLLIFFVTLGMNLSLLTIIIGHCTFLTSYVFIIVQARIAGLDPALEEASADLGASEWVTLRKVLLPQLAPGMAERIHWQGPPIARMPLHLGFYRGNKSGEQLTRQFNLGLAELRHSGELAAILQRYRFEQ